jgi:hypothetical protein
VGGGGAGPWRWPQHWGRPTPPWAGWFRWGAKSRKGPCSPARVPHREFFFLEGCWKSRAQKGWPRGCDIRQGQAPWCGVPASKNSPTQSLKMCARVVFENPPRPRRSLHAPKHRRSRRPHPPPPIPPQQCCKSCAGLVREPCSGGVGGKGSGAARPDTPLPMVRTKKHALA